MLSVFSGVEEGSDLLIPDIGIILKFLFKSLEMNSRENNYAKVLRSIKSFNVGMILQSADIIGFSKTQDHGVEE